VKHVADAFKLPNLNKAISNKTSNYIKGKDKDYVLFTCIITKTSGGDTVVTNYESGKKAKVGRRSPPQKVMFLTYMGLLHVLFVSRNTTAHYFQSWAAQILFTAQMGSPDDKKRLSSTLLGFPADTAQQFFELIMNELSSIYCFTLGTVGDSRDILQIPTKYADDLIVIRPGESNDLNRRINDHWRKYEKKLGLTLSLKFFVLIKEEHRKDAEREVLEYAKQLGNSLKFDGERDLIIADKKILDSLASFYRDLEKKYGNDVMKVKLLENKVSTLTNENMELRMEVQKMHTETQKLHTDIAQKNAIIIQRNSANTIQQQKHEIEMFKKEIEIKELKRVLNKSKSVHASESDDEPESEPKSKPKSKSKCDSESDSDEPNSDSDEPNSDQDTDSHNK
jgi:hypothetical protein